MISARGRRARRAPGPAGADRGRAASACASSSTAFWPTSTRSRALDTSATEPTSHAVPLVNVMRDDEDEPVPRPGRRAGQRAGAQRRVLPRAADHRGADASRYATIHELTAAYRQGRPPRRWRSPRSYLARIGALDAQGRRLPHGHPGRRRSPRRGRPRRATAPARRCRPWTARRWRIKDVFCTAGVRTTCGSKILERSCRRTTPPSSRGCGRPAPCSSARRTWTSSPWARRPSTRPISSTRNPWDLTRVPGGSSGGSAAAVAGGPGGGWRSAPTRAARSASRPPSAASSGSSRPTGACPATG